MSPEYSFVLWTVSASDDQKYTCTRGRSHGTHSISKQEKVVSAAAMLNECLEPNSLEAPTWRHHTAIQSNPGHEQIAAESSGSETFSHERGKTVETPIEKVKSYVLRKRTACKICNL